MSGLFRTRITGDQRLRSRVLRYGVTLAATLLALLLARLFVPVYGSHPDLFFLAAVIFSAWVSDIKTGLLSALVSAFLLDYYFQPPLYSLQLTNLGLIHLGLFLLVSIFGSVLVQTRRSSESTLAQTNQQLDVVLQGVADGITVQNRNGELVYANYAAARFSNYPSVDAFLKAPQDDYLNRFELFDEYGEPFPANSIPGRLALTGMRVPEAVIRFRNKATGEERWSNIRARPIFDADGKIIMAINVIHDITGFKTSERRLQQERNRFEVTLSSIGDAVIATDVDARVTFLNATAEKLTGWTKERAYGKDIKVVFMIFDEFEKTPSENPVERVLREGKIVGLANHTILRAQNGTEYPIDDSGAPIRDLDGNIIGAVLVFRDVTERRKAEQERAEALHREQAARAAAEEANALKLQFIAMISHELRTPLASIKGFATTLLAPDVNWDRASQEQYIAIINEESDRLAQLIEQLLDISRLQANALRVVLRAEAFSDILNSALPQLKILTAQHRFDLQIPAELPFVQADKERIMQVLVNLVDNAAKYSPPGTQVIVAAQSADGVVQVDISDEGAGIPPEDHASVFEAFRQIHRLPSQKGAGLGLAISKGLIEAHGGRIWIQGRSTPGTTVSFTLPIAKIEEQEAAG